MRQLQRGNGGVGVGCWGSSAPQAALHGDLVDVGGKSWRWMVMPNGLPRATLPTDRFARRGNNSNRRGGSARPQGPRIARRWCRAWQCFGCLGPPPSGPRSSLEEHRGGRLRWPARFSSRRRLKHLMQGDAAESRVKPRRSSVAAEICSGAAHLGDRLALSRASSRCGPVPLEAGPGPPQGCFRAMAALSTDECRFCAPSVVPTKMSQSRLGWAFLVVDHLHDITVLQRCGQGQSGR